MQLIKNIVEGIVETIHEFFYPTTTEKVSNVKYGLLYNFYAVVDEHGLAPEGWHIPSGEEMSDLITYLGPPFPPLYAGRIKEIGTEYWNSPNTGAEDTFGFSLQGAGHCWQSGGGPSNEGGLKEDGWMWTTEGNIYTSIATVYGFFMILVVI